jgi:AraC-like DNA-binding protein
MKYLTIPPPSSLARYVKCFWVYEGVGSDDKPYIYRAFADGAAELVFHYRGLYDQLVDDRSEKSISAGIHAQTSKVTRFIVRRDWGIFGCYLYPFAIPKLFSYSATDLTDQLTDFHSLLGKRGKELEDRMLNADSNLHRLKILTAFLEDRLDRAGRDLPEMVSSINHIIEARGLINIDHLAKRFCLSKRHFERKFKEFSGFSPKLYSRIVRFQSALQEYGSKKSLTDIAYDCGYYDQSHFINDFKEFSGYNPKIYFLGKAEGTEYLEA